MRSPNWNWLLAEAARMLGGTQQSRTSLKIECRKAQLRSPYVRHSPSCPGAVDVVRTMRKIASSGRSRVLIRDGRTFRLSQLWWRTEDGSRSCCRRGWRGEFGCAWPVSTTRVRPSPTARARCHSPAPRSCRCARGGRFSRGLLSHPSRRGGGQRVHQRLFGFEGASRV
jgi:hypothetical protein